MTQVWPGAGEAPVPATRSSYPRPLSVFTISDSFLSAAGGWVFGAGAAAVAFGLPAFPAGVCWARAAGAAPLHRGRPGYEPVQGGIVAALPHVDDFIAGHSVAAYSELCGVVGRA